MNVFKRFFVNISLFQVFYFILIVFISLSIIYPYLLGISLNNSEVTFSGWYSLYSQESFYYACLGPLQVPEGGLFFEDKFDRVGEGYYFINIIGFIIYYLSELFNCNMGGAFLIYKVITAGLLFFLLKSVFTKHLINKYSILIGLVVIFFTSGLGWFSDSILGWDLTAPELNFFMSISTEFYLPLALLVYIFAFNKTLHLASSFNFFSLKDSILLGVALLFLGIVYIYSLVILSGFILLIIAINYLKSKNLISLKKLGIFLFPLPVVLYYAWIYLFVINNVNSTDGFVIGPSISEYFITYFWFIIILTILILSNLREVYSNKLLQALLAYILYQFLISRVSNQYFPMQIQSYVGLAFSYTLAIVILIDKISFNYRVIALIVLTLIISTCSNIVFYKNLIYSIKNKTYPIFQSQSELDSFEFISRNIPKKAKIGVCQSRARSLSYYTENFVTYDVVIDSSKGENQFFWELLQNQTINKSEFSKHIQESGLNYFYLYQSDSSCAVSLMTYEYFVDSTNLLYQDGSISIFQIK